MIIIKKYLKVKVTINNQHKIKCTLNLYKEQKKKKINNFIILQIYLSMLQLDDRLDWSRTEGNYRDSYP